MHASSLKRSVADVSAFFSQSFEQGIDSPQLSQSSDAVATSLTLLDASRKKLTVR